MKVAEERPKVEFHEAVTIQEGLVLIGEAVKLIANFPMGQSQIFAALRKKKCSDFSRSLFVTMNPSFPMTGIQFQLTLTDDDQFPINLRKLHAALGSGQHFADWVKPRIGQLVNGEDFRVFHASMKNPLGGRPRKECYVTLDAAKAIALMENTDVGKKVRTYFIECEKELRRRSEQQDLPDFFDPVKAARAWADQFEARQELETKIVEIDPYDFICQS